MGTYIIALQHQGKWKNDLVLPTNRHSLLDLQNPQAVDFLLG
jgi:hypothetical protein